MSEQGCRTNGERKSERGRMGGGGVEGEGERKEGRGASRFRGREGMVVVERHKAEKWLKRSSGGGLE